MYWRPIAPEQWPTFLESFSARHGGWLVSLSGTIDTPSQQLPLRELRYLNGEDSVISISVGDAQAPTRLRFAGPRTVRVELNEKAVERGLAFEGLAGELSLRLRSPIAPALADRPPLPEDREQDPG